ncbi:MAG: 30S ribosome-binding factor RbfA [Rhodospirillales bacterium]|nr:30S ribosome-binding factor RbfA [Rhodospirillales bacterium]
MAAGRWESARKYRVGRAVQEALAHVLAGDSLRDPVLRDANVTVLEVRMSPDLRRADVFILPFGTDRADAPAELLEHLVRAAPYLAGAVARQARLRYAPKLHFRLDQQLDRAADVDRLLDAPSPVDAA